MATPLQYFQPSPVRGQLEPPDATTRPGWRYLQCTDTPNELKVLLPPRASQVYAYLLSQEQVELARGAEASWERLMYVRHLKDRMTRKCRRLARVSPGPGKDAQFRTLYAPPDFTLKELEKWYRNRHDANTAPPSFVQKSRKPHSGRHSHGTRGTSGRHRTTGVTASRRSSQSGLSYAEDSHYPEQTERSYFSDEDQEKTLPSVPAESFVHVEHHDALPGRIPFVSDTDLNASRPDLTSPDPIPMPYRPRESTLTELRDHLAGHITHPHGDIPPIDVVPPSDPSLTMPEPTIPEAGPWMPEPQVAPASLDRPPLVRKRSSLKRSNSRSSLKTVSWALNDGKTKYATAVEEIVYAGEELDVARTAHKEELLLLQDLHRNMTDIKERIKLDEERVKLEQQKLIDAEEAVRHQEERLRLTFEQLELHEGRYQSKVTNALDEASRSLSHRRENAIQEVLEPPV